MGIQQSNQSVDDRKQPVLPDISSSVEKELLEPVKIVTLQKCDEFLYLYRGMRRNVPAWKYVLVRYQCLVNLRQNSNEELSDEQEWGRNVEYENKTGTVCLATGDGLGPPKYLRQWLDNNYDPCSIDQSISLIYERDDIRLCEMQRSADEDWFGFFLNYHRHERFHYLTMNVDDHFSLAYRSGLKVCDRIVEFNNINIEKDSKEELQTKLDSIGKDPLKLLVCSPATYHHYKQNKLEINASLPTVKRNSSMSTITDSKFFTATETDKSVETQISLNTLTNEHLCNSFDDHMSDFHTALGGTSLQSMIETRSDFIRCQSCSTARMSNERYRCLECVNYDLCGMCFDQRCETHEHYANHGMVRFSGPNEIFGENIINIEHLITLKVLKTKFAEDIHPNTECQICKVSPIVGLRFKCDICRNYNICQTCMEQRSHHPSHTPLLTRDNRCIEISVNDIELQEELGRGGFATVYKAKWISKNCFVACKIISVGAGMDYIRQSFHKEIAAYSELSGPYIIRTYGYYVQKLPNNIEKYALIMELMERGSLTKVLHEPIRLSLRLKLDIAFQIVSGMRKLHTHQMVHRDIRPDNILITHEYTAKIGDMGLARTYSSMDKMTVVGCLPYMPPEFYSGKYQQSSDIFMFGLTLNELFTQRRHEYDLAVHRVTLIENSPVFGDLIKRCIDHQSEHRPTAVQVETVLCLHKQAFENHLHEKRINFTALTITEKDRLFLDVYDRVHYNIQEKVNFSRK